MPDSLPNGKAWGITQLAARNPRVVVDVGPGRGTWGKLVRSQLPDAHLVCVEIHRPYVDRFELRSVYDVVLVGDARRLPALYADAVVFGDVLEHMPKPDAVALWARYAPAFRLASLPLGEWEQGAVGGNPHEAHVHTWTHDEALTDLPGVTAWTVEDPIGVYIAG